MKNLGIGLVIGASLASSVGGTFKSLDKSIGQLQAKAKDIKLGISAGEKWKDLRGESLKLSSALQAGKLDAAGIARFHQLKAATKEAEAEAKKYGFTLGGLNKQLGTMQRFSAVQDGFLRRAEARDARKQERGELRSQLAGTMAVGATLALPIYQAVQFESVMADVRKVVNFDTPQQFQKMGQDILDLSTKLPVSASGIGEIVAAAGQFGIARDEILDFSNSAAKMAIAFDIPAATAGEAMAKIRASTGITQVEMVKLGDAINHLSNNTAANAGELVEFMKRSAGVGKIAGLAESQTAALGTTFIAMGSAPEVAARATNAFVMKLATASKQSKPVLEALGDMGYSAQALEKRMKLDPQGTILEFLERAKKQKNVLAALSGVFGVGWSDDIAKLVTGLDTYKKSLELVADEKSYHNSMEEEYQARAATTANELQLLRNQTTRLGVTIGSALLPGLNAVLKPLGKMIETVGTLAARYPTLTKIIGGAAAGFLGLKAATLATRIGWSHIRDGGSIAIDVFQRLRPSVIANSLAMARMRGEGSALNGMFSGLRGGVGSFLSGFGADFKAFQTGMGAMFTPLTMSVMALAGAIYLVWRNWEDFSGAWKEGCSEMGKAWEEGRIGDAIMSGLATPLTSIMVLIRDVTQGLSNLFGMTGDSTALDNAVGAAQERLASGNYNPGDEYVAMAGISGHASGGLISRPVVSWVGEDGPEVVVPIGSKHRQQGLFWLGKAASALGMSLSEKGATEPSAGASPSWIDRIRDFSASVMTAPQPALAGAGGITNNFTINPTPGMDEQGVADLIIRKLEDWQRGQAAKRRSSYHDDAFLG